MEPLVFTGRSIQDMQETCFHTGQSAAKQALSTPLSSSAPLTKSNRVLFAKWTRFSVFCVAILQPLIARLSSYFRSAVKRLFRERIYAYPILPHIAVRLGLASIASKAVVASSHESSFEHASFIYKLPFVHFRVF
jgi:hypothetical protein